MATIAIATQSRKRTPRGLGNNPKTSMSGDERVLDMHRLNDEDSPAGSSLDLANDVKYIRRASYTNTIKALHALTTEEIQQMNDSIIPKPCVSPTTQILIIWLVWMFGGALVYYWLNPKWTYATSLYYAANVGYSIGYGALYEYNEWSLAWSLVMIVMGASVIGGAIGFFAANAIDASGDYKAPEENTLMGDDMPCSYLAAKWRSAQTFYASHKLFVKVYSLLFLWIIMGVIYGTVHEEWSFLRSVYFAVSGMSTAGLQAPTATGVGEERHLEDFPALFVFFFSLTGVPIFGLALGQLGGLLVDHHILAKERASMAKLLTKDEFDSVSSMDYSAGDAGAELVSFAEFALLEMLRLGKTNVEQMKHIKEEFQRRDEDGSGDLTWEEIRLFQVSRAARSMEVQLLMRRDRLSIENANDAVFGNEGKGVEEKQLEELDILTDMGTFLEQAAANEASRRASDAASGASFDASSGTASDITSSTSSGTDQDKKELLDGSAAAAAAYMAV